MATSKANGTNFKVKTPVIKSFGIQSETDRTLYTTWRWNGGVVNGKDRTDHYRVLWEYTTGDKDSSGSIIWFTGNDSTTTKEQSTYNAPSNATRVRVRVKAIAKKHTVNKKEVAWFTTTGWSTIKGTVKAVIKITDPIVIGQPSAPTVTIENYVLTASLSNISSDINADQIVFEIIQDDSVDFNTIPAYIVTSSASVSCNVVTGHNYKARCVAYNSKEDDQGEWSEYSSNVGTIPVGPNGFASIEAASETSVKLTWEATTNATGYDIEYASDRNYFDTSNQTQTLSIEGGGSTVGIVTGLETGKEWFFRLRAKNANGESTWSGIVSVVIGKDPAAPTTWSSTTTCTAGEKITLYWVHNAEDNSPQTSAEIEIKLSVNDSVISTDTIPITTSDEDATKTYSYEYDTTSLTENTNISWRVRTAGITGNYSEWSTVREINVYAPPNLALEVTDQNGTAIDTVTEYPIRIKGTPGPESQKAVSMYLEVIANESYTTIDNIGNEQLVKKGEKIYSTVVDRPSTEYGCIFWLYPSSINLDNNISYTVNCLVSMDTGLTAEASKTFDVAWTETEYVPSAEIGINKDDISAYIRPYVEASEEDGSGDESGGGNESTIDISFTAINVSHQFPEYSYITFYGVTYGNGRYVGTGAKYVQDDYIRTCFYSSDGINWSEGTISASYISRPFFVNDKFIAYESRKGFHYSTDGKKWTLGTCDEPGFKVNNIIYANDKYIAVGEASQNHAGIYSSENGINWYRVYTDRTIEGYTGGEYGILSVAYGNGLFVALNNRGSRDCTTIYYSEDGIDWMTHKMYGDDMFAGPNDLIYNEGKFIAIGECDGDNLYYRYSEDGWNWTKSDPIPNAELEQLPSSGEYGIDGYGIVYYNNTYFIVGNDYGGATAEGALWYSINGGKWTKFDDANGNVLDEDGNVVKFLYGSDATIAINVDKVLVSSLEGYIYYANISPWKQMSTLPYRFYDGATVVYNNEIHILGSDYSSNRKSHYKWDGNNWTQLDDVPYEICNCCAVVYNNEIHILSSSYSSAYEKYHYKWDGTNWTEVSTLPESLSNGAAVVYNNEIHVFRYTYHYKWNGTNWIKVSDLPKYVYYPTAVVYNNEIHIINGAYWARDQLHLKWNGVEWTEVSTLPYKFPYRNCAVVYNNEIHILGSGSSDSNEIMKSHYKWNGENWEEVSILPYNLYRGAAIVYDNAIHILGSNSSDIEGTSHYSLTIASSDSGQTTYPSLTLSVYRREFDGDFTKIATGIKNGSNTYVIDPHPALDFARYRIVAIDNETGAVSYNDPPGYPVDEKAIIIQWDEKWSNFDVDPDNEDALTNPPWTGSLLKLPYNVDVADSNETDVSLVEYIGRKHPVSYYGTQRGETASWSVDIPKSDKDTLYALRRLRVYMGDAYVREPSGSGYWARIKVSFSQTHCETVIPVSIDITRVEGGK